jgi:hypothetical protein
MSDIKINSVQSSEPISENLGFNQLMKKSDTQNHDRISFNEPKRPFSQGAFMELKMTRNQLYSSTNTMLSNNFIASKNVNSSLGEKDNIQNKIKLFDDNYKKNEEIILSNSDQKNKFNEAGTKTRLHENKIEFHQNEQVNDTNLRIRRQIRTLSQIYQDNHQNLNPNTKDNCLEKINLAKEETQQEAFGQDNKSGKAIKEDGN